MKKPVYKTLIIIVGLILLAFVMSINLYFQPNHSTDKNKILTIGITDSVIVIRKTDDTTRIRSNNVEDIYYTLGYLTAQDQLYHLTKLAAAARGNLSSIFGKRALKADQFILLLGIPREAESAFSQLTPGQQRIMQRYCDGINHYIDSTSQLQLPLELKHINAKPIRWRPADIIACQNLLAIKTQNGLFTDLLTSIINEFYSNQKINELIGPLELELNPSLEATPADQLYELIALTNEFEKSFLEFFGHSPYGYKRLAVKGNSSRDKKPQLIEAKRYDANDPFIGKFYQIEYPGSVYSGEFLPGFPFSMTGRNQTAAWATSIFMELEFIKIPTNQNDPDVYLLNNDWHTMVHNEIVIPIRDGEPFILKYRSTEQGPVISDLTSDNISGNIVVMKKAAPINNRAINLLRDIIDAGSGSDIADAMMHHRADNISTLYADTLGNIGLLKSYNSVNQSGEILLENIINPDKNYIITDRINNWLMTNKGDANGDYEALTKTKILKDDTAHITKEDLQKAFLKLESAYNVALAERIIELIPTINDTEIEYALKELKKWNGEISTESTGELIFNTTLNHLFVNLYKDELDLLGPELFQALKNIPEILLAGIWKALHDNNYSWTDNIQTVNEIETTSEIVAFSLQGAAKEIHKEVSGAHNRKFWSKSHSAEIIQHNFFDLSKGLSLYHPEMQPSLMLIPEK